MNPEKIEKALSASELLSVEPPIADMLEVLFSYENAILIDWAELVTVDPALTCAVISMANGSKYADEPKVSSVKEAFKRLDRDTVRVVLQNELERKPEETHCDCGVGRASVMEALATKFGLRSDVAYTIGILSNVGRPFVENALKGSDYEGEGLTYDLEEATLGYHFGHLGGRLLEQFGFPREVYLGVEYQCEPEKASESSEYAWLVNVGERCSKKLIAGVSLEDTSEWAEEIAVLEERGKNARSLMSALRKAQMRIRDFRDIMHALEASVGQGEG